MNEGIAAFKHGNYQQAVELFRQAVALDPDGVNPHLYLGTAYMSVPSQSEHLAETEFNRVLELDANNTVALASLASLAYNSASSMQGEEKTHRFDESMAWYKRLAAVDPTNKEAQYSMGVIVWAKWYPALMTARAKLRMKPEDPGPLPDPARQELKTQYSSMLEDGISYLDRALQLDPQYSDALAYMNLLIRERADLRDTQEEYRADVAVADQLVQKALEAKKARAQSGMSPPPPAPPVPSRGGGGASRVRMRELNPVLKVEPVYPPLARQAHISGMVRFTLIIGKDGKIQNIQLVSGHPLLVAAALDAVKQYVYNPTLLNGEPVEVVTQANVVFSFGN